MLFSILATAFVGAASVLAAPANSTVQIGYCGTNITPAQVAAAEASFEAKEVSTEGIFDDILDVILGHPIPVYIHVVAANKTAAGGWISDAQILAQMTILNLNYLPTGMKFLLKGVTRTIEPSWYDFACPGTGSEYSMKLALRKGDVKTLNVYSVGCTLKQYSGVLGWSTFPWNYESQPVDDGSVIRYDVWPGGAYKTYDQGKTLVHEVGHWAGLYHTFMGGCDGDGDYVDDTPAEAGAVFGCPTGLDSCPNSPGVDNIHNFMAWTDDRCMNRFTRGQIKRLAAQLRAYRKIKV